MMWGFRRLKWCNVRSDVLSIAVALVWGYVGLQVDGRLDLDAGT